MWDEFKDRPFKLLALTDESPSQIEKFVPEKGMTYPTGAGASNASARAFGVSGYPSAYLINHEGVVIWKGHPSSLSTGIIEEAIVAAEADGPWDPGERHEVLDKAVEAAKAGKMGVAWKAAESARKKAGEDPLALDAIETFQDDLLERGAGRLAKAQKYTEDGRYFQAVEYLESQIAAYKGSPLEKEWKALIKVWLKDKDIKAQYGFDEDRRDALMDARNGDREKALKSLQKLMEKAEGLPIAARIKADFDAIRSAG